MNAKKTNIVNTNRTRLEKVIPLNTPFSICIDPSNACNFKCNFCAIQKSNDLVGFKKTQMSIDLFKKIIDDLTEFDHKLKVIRISGQGEPLLNKKYVDMVEYAKEKKVADYLETITNGSYLNPELNQKIVDSGLDRMRISIESVDENGYWNNAGVKINLEKFIDNIRDLYERSRGRCEIYIKTVDAAVPRESDRDKFYELFGNICDKIFIDKVIPLWSDFKELNDYYTITNESGIHGQDIKIVKICPFPFYSCIINSDGQVTACCADWKRKLILGDVSKESVYNIWHGDKMKSFWMALASKEKDKFEMCKKCVLPTFDCNDDIDEYGDEILKNIKNERI